jgi:hypothetical protein
LFGKALVPSQQHFVVNAVVRVVFRYVAFCVPSGETNARSCTTEQQTR